MVDQNSQYFLAENYSAFASASASHVHNNNRPKQRANSFDEFQQGILDKHDDDDGLALDLGKPNEFEVGINQPGDLMQEGHGPHQINQNMHVDLEMDIF